MTSIEWMTEKEKRGLEDKEGRVKGGKGGKGMTSI